MDFSDFEINTNSSDDFKNGAFELISRLRPEWGSQSQYMHKVFTDGLTNKLIGVYIKEARKDMILIRVYGQNSDLMIDRQKEIRNMKILHKNGCGAQLYATFKNGIAYQYQSGSTLTVESICSPNIFPSLAAAFAKMHSIKESLDDKEIGAIDKTACLWDLLRKFQSLVPEGFPDNPEKDAYYNDVVPYNKVELTNEIDRMEKTFMEKGILERAKVVFAHNDLMPNNILVDYAGTEVNVSIIDYEYGDWNYREFDIANHFNEFVGLPDEKTGILDYDKYYPSQDFQLKWLEVYLKHTEKEVASHEDLNGNEFRQKVEELQKLVDTFSPLSNLLWGIWSLIQSKYSDIDFDYINYAMQRLKQYKKCSAKI